METIMVVLTFESVDEILWCALSNEISSAVLLHVTISFVAFEKVKFRIFLKILVWPLLEVKELIIISVGYIEMLHGFNLCF